MSDSDDSMGSLKDFIVNDDSPSDDEWDDCENSEEEVTETESETEEEEFLTETDTDSELSETEAVIQQPRRSSRKSKPVERYVDPNFRQLWLEGEDEDDINNCLKEEDSDDEEKGASHDDDEWKPSKRKRSMSNSP
jgi:hypothetical protein